jgi:hypothetical protein
MLKWLRGRKSQIEIDRELEILVSDLGGDPSIVALWRAQRLSAKLTAGAGAERGPKPPTSRTTS